MTKNSSLGAIPLGLVLLSMLLYGRSVGMPFIGDDYVFLDKARSQSVSELFGLGNTDFGWYRPWSRELHFWVLHRLFGLSEVAFRIVGMGLWCIGLLLYHRLVTQLAGPRAAGLSLLGAASLGLWGTPILWISGSQDLWLLVWGVATLSLGLSGRFGWATATYALALLSKETAVVLPLILLASLVLAGVAKRRLMLGVLPLLGTTLAWLLIHPTLKLRLLGPQTATAELEHRPALPLLGLKTLLASINLDAIPMPVDVSLDDVALAVAAAALVGALGWSLRQSRGERGPQAPSTGRVVLWGALWAVIGWSPLFMPSIGWHAYYGGFGALGAWLPGGVLLSRRPRLVPIVLICLVLVRSARAETLSWDWGNEWYQRRAGRILEAVRQGLRSHHPTLEPNTRIYFANIPNNIGLIAGRSPAVRVWYDDSSLNADFYSGYRVRQPNDPPGEDLFFRLDTLAGLVEVDASGGSSAKQIASISWEHDQEVLAMLFLRNGDPVRSASQFRQLARLPHRADALVLASAALWAARDTAESEGLLRVASARLGRTHADLEVWRSQLVESIPRPRSSRER